MAAAEIMAFWVSDRFPAMQSRADILKPAPISGNSIRAPALRASALSSLSSKDHTAIPE
jgi:hypothetical protein